MNIFIVLLCVIQASLVTAAVSYWLHMRSVKRMSENFARVLQETVEVILDDPTKTVKVHQVSGKKVDRFPYDWATEEAFEQIIDSNYPPDK